MHHLFIFTILQAELLWELQQDLDVAGGLLHCLSHSSEVVLQSSACKLLLVLSRHSLLVETGTVEKTALHVTTGEEAGTAVWEHIRNQEQEQYEPQGVRNNVIVPPGDEQRTTLATANMEIQNFPGGYKLTWTWSGHLKSLGKLSSKGCLRYSGQRFLTIL